MSYSFSVRSASKAAAVEAVEAKMAEVVASQPIHEKDQESAIGAAATMLSLMGDPPVGHEFSVSVNGSIWQQDGIVRGVSVGVNIGHALVEAAD